MTRCSDMGWQGCSAHHLMQLCLLRQAINGKMVVTVVRYGSNAVHTQPACFLLPR